MRHQITTLLLTLAAVVVEAATLPQGFREVLVASGISAPTAMAIAPDGRIFVAEQGGGLRVVRNGALLPTPFVTLNVDPSGERGLLGVAFDPQFSSNGFVYLYYTSRTPTLHNRVSRFTANGDVAQPGSEMVLLDLDDLSAATNHNGGAIHFGPDGLLYVASGDNANGANAQTLQNLFGKILRIRSDGTIPENNPFFATVTGRNRSIWAIGLRNPFTFAVQRGTGRVFINDVGAASFEEINDGVAGGNYGWPATEGPTTDPRFRSPIYSYRNDASTCAIAGGAFYNPNLRSFPSTNPGSYFFADLCGGWIMKLDPSDANRVSPFATAIPQPVDLAVSEDGDLYYLARGSGSLFRITPVVSRGDANGDQAIGVADIFYLINFLFTSGPPPVGSGDADSSGTVSVADVFYLITYLFQQGPPPA